MPVDTGVQASRQERFIKRRVFFNSGGALIKGQGVCYQRASTGTGSTTTPPLIPTFLPAVNYDAIRDKCVILPDNTSNLAFAGVCVQDYSARTGGQWIEIYEPGSVCPILVVSDGSSVPTIGQTNMVTCIAGNNANSLDQGCFSSLSPGFAGRGTARLMQSAAANTAQLTISSVAWASGVATYTTSATHGLVSGQRVTIFGMTQTGYNGTFVVVAAPTGTTFTVNITTNPGATSTGTANPWTLLEAELLNGEESGLVEKILPIAAGGATTFMVGGVSVLQGATIAANVTNTLANGTYAGQKKTFWQIGTMVTSVWVVTVTTGRQLGATTALATLTYTATTNKLATLMWDGLAWQVLTLTVTSPAQS